MGAGGTASPVLASSLQETVDGYHGPAAGGDGAFLSFLLSFFYPLPPLPLPQFLLFHSSFSSPSRMRPRLRLTSLPVWAWAHKGTLEGTGVWGALSVSRRKAGTSQSSAGRWVPQDVLIIFSRVFASFSMNYCLIKN